MDDVRQQLSLASEHLRAGRAADAQALLERLLQRDPRCAPALNLLAGVAHRAGDFPRVIDLLRRALEIEPRNPNLYLNLGEALARTGRPDEAEKVYRQGLAIAPDMPDLHTNLGSVLLTRSDLPGALQSLERAVALAPRFAEAHYNLGRARHAAGDLAGAIASARAALALREPFAAAHYNRGTALREQGDLQSAAHHLRRSLELRPDYPAALNNLGLTLLDLHQPGESARILGQALRLKPDYAAAWTNLGNALSRLRDVTGAISAHRRAVSLNPASADLASSLLMSLLYDPHCTPEMHNRELTQFEARFGRPAEITPHPNDPSPERRLRIGYLSSDFREHVVARNILPLFEHHDRDAFEIVAFYNHPRQDQTTACIRQLCTSFHSIHRQSDLAVAEAIRRERIDILVDLNVHSSGNRIPVLALKPAPVQITFAGYPGSTGLHRVGYRISDPYLDPAGSRHGPERILHIPSFWCYRPNGADLPVLPSPVLQAGHLTFGSLNSPAKLNDELLCMWATILERVPSSRLLLLAWDSELRQRIAGIFQARGISGDRLRFSAHAPHDEYMRLYNEIDIILDPMPYNGHTTSLDALWMGVPVVTLAGPTPASRGGLSQLANLNLAELVAHDREQYIQIATDLARDPTRLESLRSAMRQRLRGSVLMDERRFAREIELRYREAWRAWCTGTIRGESPNHA